MRGESVDDVELLIRNRERPDGVSISVNARPLRDDAGELRGGIIVLRDITEMKKTESNLRQTVQHLQEQAELMETIFNCIAWTPIGDQARDVDFACPASALMAPGACS